MQKNKISANTKLLFSIAASALMLLACSTDDHQKTNDQKIKTDTIAVDSSDVEFTEMQYITDPALKRIIAADDTIYKGDTLRIQFKTPHPRDFAIVSPDGRFLFVINPNKDSLMPSLMDPEKFEKTNLLEIITDKTKVSPFDASINHNTIIFTKTGKYELRLSEVLCMDDGTPLETNSVYYIDAPRKR